MFETQKSGNKTSSGEIGLNIRTLASPKVGQDQVSITDTYGVEITVMALKFNSLIGVIK